MNSKLFRTLLITVAFLCVTPTMAQTTFSPKQVKKYEKAYNKAIKKGRDSNGAYKARLKYDEHIPFCKYLKQKGLFPVSTSFGIIFIEDEFIEDYVCKTHMSHSLEEFTKNSFYHYSNWKMVVEGWGSVYATRKGEFRRHKISWLGNVVNGNIEGKGIGFFREDDVFYFMTNGEFHHGFPITDVDITQIKYDIKRNAYIVESKKSIKLAKEDNDNILYRGLYGSDPLTQKAAIAYYKDYYAGKAEKERSELDENTYNNIKSKIDVDFYIGAFPNGRHSQEVSQWVPNNYAGFRAHQQETIDQAFELIQTYINEKMNGGSNLLEMETTKPISGEISKIKDENERLLKKASNFSTDIKNNLANDKHVEDKVQRFYDYLDILNGFYAIKNSFDVRSCVGVDLWDQIISPNPKTTYTLNRKGREIKSLFEKAGKTILKRIDEEQFAEYDLLEQTYEYIYKYYSSFIKSINGQLAMENRQHVSEKLSSSSFKEYKFEDGQLVIELENGDVYRFHQSEGKWKYSSGNTAKVFPGAIGYNSIADAIEEAERMNRDYWNRGR